jgi:hypothetical protein
MINPWKTTSVHTGFSLAPLHPPQNLTFVSEALGIPDPAFLLSSKMFFNSAFSALNYKYNNNNTSHDLEIMLQTMLCFLFIHVLKSSHHFLHRGEQTIHKLCSLYFQLGESVGTIPSPNVMITENCLTVTLLNDKSC